MDKEYYIKQVEKVAEYLKSRADILFLDIREPISNVNINIDINPTESAEVQINKTYYPEYIKGE